MRNKVFLAFTGVKGSGKTTSFECIKQAYPNVIEVTLAKKLKDVCATVFNVPRAHFDDPAYKEKELDELVWLNVYALTDIFKSFGLFPNWEQHIRPHLGRILVSPRHIAQYIGTEVLRSFGEDVHCAGATHDLPESGLFVVTDMRFPNEFAYFQTRYAENFHPIFIHNPVAEAHVVPTSHASERHVFELAKRCTKIDNTGTIEELRTKVLTVAFQAAPQFFALPEVSCS